MRSAYESGAEWLYDADCRCCTQGTFPTTAAVRTTDQVIADALHAEAVQELNKPAMPPNRLIRECDGGRLCPDCGSSLARRWWFFRTSAAGR
jgi:hypothetical protein